MFDFEIKNNLIFTDNTVVVTSLLEPKDIFLLNRQDQDYFFHRISHFFNLLKGEIQFTIFVKPIGVSDYDEHFMKIMNDVRDDTMKQEYANRIISSLKEIIIREQRTILKKKYYFHIKESHKNTAESVDSAINKLNSGYQKTVHLLQKAGITASQLLDEDLLQFIYEYQ